MFSIVKNYKIFFSITIIFLLIGFGSIVTRGFNLGIDFTGGSIVDLTFENPVNVAQVRDVLKEHDMGNSIIQLENSDGKTEANSVLIRTGVVEDTELRATMNDLQSKLGNYQIQRVEQVGATIGSELVQQAAMAIVLSWVLMIAYITFRFEFKFAIAAIIALIIDVLVVLSYFSLFQMEMDSSFVAALLTVVGYSVNGTIVIFDRIRENLKIPDDCELCVMEYEVYVPEDFPSNEWGIISPDVNYSASNKGGGGIPSADGASTYIGMGGTTELLTQKKNEYFVGNTYKYVTLFLMVKGYKDYKFTFSSYPEGTTS